MAQRLGYVFLIILALAFFNYIGTRFSQALASYGSSADPSLVAGISPNMAVGNGSSGGLPSIDFTLFSKNGSGWDHITQGYGVTPYAAWYVGGWHNGIDIAAQFGAPIYSPRASVILAIGNQDAYCPERGFGKFVAASDPEDDVVLWYAHLGQINVSAGESISRDTEIGTIGATGFETGTHLHFSVFKADGFLMKNKNGCGPDADGKDVDPVPYLEEFGATQ